MKRKRNQRARLTKLFYGASFVSCLMLAGCSSGSGDGGQTSSPPKPSQPKPRPVQDDQGKQAQNDQTKQAQSEKDQRANEQTPNSKSGDLDQRNNSNRTVTAQPTPGPSPRSTIAQNGRP